MIGSRWLSSASVVVALAVATSAFAQGKTQEHKKGSPPSRSELPAPTMTLGPSRTGAAPLAWIDDATLLEPGSMSIAISMMRWQGSAASEVDVPVVDAAVGLGRRLQLSASVPRIVGGAQPDAAVAGLGTTYISAKVGIVGDGASAVKLAIAPTLEILGQGALQSITADSGRAQWGVPVSLEIDRGAARAYGGAGYFSRGVWFAGAGTAWQATSRFGVSAGFSRAWVTAGESRAPVVTRDRNEVSGGAAFALTDSASVFGSIGRTIATSNENGAGTSVSAGVSFSISSKPARP